MTAEERQLAKERYLKVLADISSGITLDTPAGRIEGTVQNLSQAQALSAALTKLSVEQGWAAGAQQGIDAAKKMTHSQILHQGRVNSGWYETHPLKSSNL